jgi:hypothetical protein
MWVVKVFWKLMSAAFQKSETGSRDGKAAMACASKASSSLAFE